MTIAGKTLRVLAVASSVTLMTGYVAISQSTSRTLAHEGLQQILIPGSKAIAKPVFDTGTLKGVGYYVFRPFPGDLMSSSKSAMVRRDVLEKIRFTKFGVRLTAEKP